MTIPKDKLLHLALGVAFIVYGAVAIVIFQDYGAGPAAAWLSTAGGIGYELNQKIRGEGEPSWADALATAIPGWMLWAILASMEQASA